jgi:hypothetical protein
LHGARRIRFGRVVGERAAEAGARGGEEGHGPRAMGMPAAGDGVRVWSVVGVGL